MYGNVQNGLQRRAIVAIRDTRPPGIVLCPPENLRKETNHEKSSEVPLHVFDCDGRAACRRLSTAWAQTAPSLGTAANFAVLSAGVPGMPVTFGALTCTDSTVIGDVGAFGAFTNTTCTILGQMPPATNGRVAQARTDFNAAYAAIRSPTVTPCTVNSAETTLPTGPLSPGVYCFDAAVTAVTGSTLTLSGPADGSGFSRSGPKRPAPSRVPASRENGRRRAACNVFWVPSADVTFTTSAIKGNILAGDLATDTTKDGAITLTGGTLDGRALANVEVTMTNTASPVAAGCRRPPGSLSCNSDERLVCEKKHHQHDKKATMAHNGGNGIHDIPSGMVERESSGRQPGQHGGKAVK